MASEWEACARAIEFCVYRAVSCFVSDGCSLLLPRFLVYRRFFFCVFLLILGIIDR